jgi:hypothetical protein
MGVPVTTDTFPILEAASTRVPPVVRTVHWRKRFPDEIRTGYMQNAGQTQYQHFKQLGISSSPAQ